MNYEGEEAVSVSSEEDDQNCQTLQNCQTVDQLQPKLKLFIENMQKINSQLQATGNALTKEAQNSGGTGQY